MQELLARVHSEIQKNLDREEAEVTSVFDSEGFFEELEYEGIGLDVRSEKHIVGQNRPDYFAKDQYGNVVFVIEFKKPSRDDDLASHKPQLWEQYVKPLKADYGVLTDGQELIFYERGLRNQPDRKFRVELDEVTTAQAALLENLRKPEIRFETKAQLREYFDDLDTVSVGELIDGEAVGRNEFFDTFRLDTGTLFYQMLERTYDLIEYYVENGQDGNFPKDSYEFWEEYYAADPGWYDLPEEWRDIAGTANNKGKVMFAVETVQSFLGRLMLAKACEDYDFPGIDLSRFFIQETRDLHDNLIEETYIEAASSLMDQMRQELVESVFEQDLYYWWNVPAEDMEDATSRDVAEMDWPAPVTQFSHSLVDFVAAIARFDFSEIEGDPLGDLYQQYFDPKTRRALGEFYTSPDIVDYILDSVEYEGDNHYHRLIDPACGSGTFPVKALRRFKEGIDDDANWAVVLQNLCEESRIVGIDIHPFAVVLAQIRFMLELLPEYKRAIEQESTFILRRLPIYRTDSLIDESEVEEGVQQTLYASYNEEKIEFEMTLPIRDGQEFGEMQFELPRFNHVQDLTSGEIDRREDYFTGLLAVFDAVKERAERDDFEISHDELEPYFRDYYKPEQNIAQITSAYLDTADDFLDDIKKMQKQYNDGRLLRLVEDVVLGSILKNDIDYHYVVGNPPWVSKHSRYRDEEQDRRMKQKYLSAWKETDTYLQFIERGLDMLEIGGTLGFIVSNRYLYNMHGEEIRGLLAKNQIRKVIDFTDVALFEDATNYSSILTVEKTVDNSDWSSFIEDGKFSNQYQIQAARVRGWDEDNISGLIDHLSRQEGTDTLDVFEIDSRRFQERAETKNGRINRIEVSERFTDTDQPITITKQLPQVDVWPVVPPEEYEIIDKVESSMNLRLGDTKVIRSNSWENSETLVGDDIRVGIQTSGDGVYVVEPEVRISANELRKVNQLSIRPTGIADSYLVETDLLKIDINGENADRWLPDWDGRLVFVPYIQGDKRAELISPTKFESNYPKTWAYFTEPAALEQLAKESKERKELHNRLAAYFGIIPNQGSKSAFRQYNLSSSERAELSEALRENPNELTTLDKEMWWYRYMYRKNIETLPQTKVMSGDLSQYNKLCFDEDGSMAPHNVSVYAIMIGKENRYAIAAVLNSAVTEFYHKLHARINQAKHYRYIEDYTSKWPVVVPEGETADELTELVEDILDLKNLESRVEQFPDPYVAERRDEGEEFAKVTYTPSKTFVANPISQSELDNGHRVVLDGGDVTDDVIQTQAAADYVAKAFRGVKLRKNTTYTIPVPTSPDTVVDILRDYEDDNEKLSENDISDLEQRIDDIVFDIYGIEDESKRTRIMRFNTQYKEVRALEDE